MKKWSITWKVTIWYTLLMTLLVILTLGVLFSISSVQMQSGVRTNLQSVVSESFDTLESDDGYIEIDDDLDYFKRGGYLSVFDGNGHFIYGKMPGEFLSEMEFKADEMQTISENGADWYVYDAYLNGLDWGRVKMRFTIWELPLTGCWTGSRRALRENDSLPRMPPMSFGLRRL